jgi:hypothetical protein
VRRKWLKHLEIVRLHKDYLFMNTLTLILSLITSLAVSAQPTELLKTTELKLTDIAKRGYKKEVLFSQMNRDLIKVRSSICSNRAMIWAYDFQRKQSIESGKIFLFYTEKKTGFGQITWWYHVAPVINENGNLYVMDAGFPGFINNPLTTNDWLKTFSHSSRCKEILPNETDLIEKMFDGMIFPKTTRYGTYDCYYHLSQPGYWTPSSVAMGLLGVNEKGESVNYSRDQIEIDEVYLACLEAVTMPLGWALGEGKSRCKKYLGIKPD